MDGCHLLESPPLLVGCPHCGHPEADDHEVIEQGSILHMRCPECRATFCLELAECASCGAESLFTWECEPADAVSRSLTCPACGCAYVDGDESPVPPVVAK